MPKLPGISQRDAVRVFQKLGYHIARESGHIIMSKEKYKNPKQLWFYKDFVPDGAGAVRKYHIPKFSNWTAAVPAGSAAACEWL